MLFEILIHQNSELVHHGQAFVKFSIISIGQINRSKVHKMVATVVQAGKMPEAMITHQEDNGFFWLSQELIN